MAVVEFLLSQSCKHQTSEKVFSKDLLQMGMAIENANAIVKAFVDQGEHIHRVQKQNSMRVSQIQGLDYSLSYMMASSSTGSIKNPENGAVQPLDISVKVSVDLKQFPKV